MHVRQKAMNALNRSISQPSGRFAPSVACWLSLAFFVAVPVLAQPLSVPPLDPDVVTSVDRLYPGFTEILESNDSAALARLARTLSENPSPESLTVLLWMLQYCPSWSADGAVLQIGTVVRAVGTLPVEPISGALLRGNADQRTTAATILGFGNDLTKLRPPEKQALEQTLIAALSDPNLHVRESVARLLRVLGSAKAPPRRSPLDPGSSSTGPDASTFSRATVAAVSAVSPDFLDTLRTQDEPAVRKLLAAIEGSDDPATTPVLVWLLANGDSHLYGRRLANRLSEPRRAASLPYRELAILLATRDPDHRLVIAELFAQVMNRRDVRIAPGDRRRIIAASIERLQDPSIDVRIQAVRAVGSARAVNAVPALIASLDGRDVTRHFVSTVMSALQSIGNREALPVLERLAGTASSQQVRQEAAIAHITIAKPRDPAGEGRRLLWEPPDTALERQVLSHGRTALPAVWQALATGSTRERRAAAALLGWFPDVRSIRPILAALARSPGALTRDQLLFDLNMILLVHGSPADAGQRNALAAEHLHWLYGQLADQPIDSDIRSAVFAQNTIAVFPDPVAAPFSAELSTHAARDGSVRPLRFSATARRFESPQAFLDWVSKAGCGVAFHAMTAVEGVARVATTLYLPGGRIANQVWITLYRREGGRWMPLQVPPHPVLHRMMNEPNLLPTINRNYGADHPLKVLRLDLTMERIRVDLKARHRLDHENLETPGTFARLDESYVRLLDRYKRSDAPTVRYTAEFESARLTGQPNVQFWIDTLAQHPGSPFQTMALEVLARFALRQFEQHSIDLTGVERAQLVAAALSPQAVDPRLLPEQLPRPEDIQEARRSGRFGLVSAAFGAGHLGMSGYSMLFERRGDRWVFLCIVRSWIS